MTIYVVIRDTSGGTRGDSYDRPAKAFPTMTEALLWILDNTKNTDDYLAVPVELVQ